MVSVNLFTPAFGRVLDLVHGHLDKGQSHAAFRQIGELFRVEIEVRWGA
ncbi:hypothetical protein N8D56_16490 [Devosia sp. A8/3-2]|nr:hypothetical protein N8D56_16490 [Devosia sp. A8/3-2]